MADGWFDTTPDEEWPWVGLPPGPELAAALHVAPTTALARLATAHNRTRDTAGWIAQGDGRWRRPLGRTYTTLRHQPLPMLTNPVDTDPPPL